MAEIEREEAGVARQVEDAASGEIGTEELGDGAREQV
jgi:hypothetical protein